MSAYTLHDGRPESLIYLDHDFHVLDLQVLVCVEISILLHSYYHQLCQCSLIQFGCVDEVLHVHGRHNFHQTVSESVHLDSSSVDNVDKVIIVYFSDSSHS